MPLSELYMKTLVKRSNIFLTIAILFALGLAIYLQMQFNKVNQQIFRLEESIVTTNILLSEELLQPASGVVESDVQSGVVLYKMLENVKPNQLKSLNGLLKGQGLLKELPMGPSGVTMARFDGSSHGREKAISKMLQKSGLVEFAEPDYKVELSVEANDPDYTAQWHHKTVKTPQAWNVTTGDHSVLVAVCDTGVDTAHPDLIDNLRLDLAWNAHEDSTYVKDANGHGTGTIGVLGAVGNNSTGVSGINWDVDIIPIRIAISDTNSGAYTSTMAKCIEYAADQGAKIVNMSYTGVYSSTVDSAAQYLRDKGGLLFMAAANSGEEQTWPDFPSSVAVAATDQDNKRASFSNWGEFVDITAPGVTIKTTYKNKSYTNYSGTSFSSPLVAGIATLMVSANPNITPDQIENGLFSTATYIGDEYIFGSGLADAEAAVQYALNLAGDAPKAEMYISTDTARYDESISFSAANSIDNDGKVTSYLWEFGDGNTSSQAESTHAYTQAGAYTVTLKVTDNDGLIGTAQQIIQVTNEIPVIEALTADVIEGEVPLVVNFNQITSDSDGEIVSYAWDFGDGNQSSEQYPNHTYTSQGSFEARLTVSDNAGGLNSKAIQIDANDPNYLPLNPVENVTVSSNGKTLMINWTDNSTNEDGFIVSRYKPETGYYTEHKIAPNLTSLSIDIAQSSTQVIQVWSFNASEQSSKSNEITYYIDINAVESTEASINTPADIKVSSNGKTLTVSWADNSIGESGFILSRYKPETGYYIEHTIPANSNTFNIDIAQSSTQAIQLWSFNETKESPKSAEIKYYIDVDASSSSSGNLEQPIDVEVSSDGTTLIIKWTDSSVNEDGFVISRYKPETGYYTEHKVPANSNSFNIDIASSSTQVIQVWAYNADEQSAKSPEIEYYIDTSSDSSSNIIPPSNITVTSTGSTLSINWIDNSVNEDGFIISRYKPETGYYIEHKVAPNSTAFNVDILVSSTQVIQIWAFNSDGDSEKSEKVEYFIDINQ